MSESPETDDDDENSPNGETIQRQEQPSKSQDDAELSPQAEAIQLQEEPAHLQDEEMQPVQDIL